MVLRRRLKVRLFLYLLAMVSAVVGGQQWVRRHVVFQPTHDASDSIMQELQFYRFSPLPDDDEKIGFRGFVYVPNVPQKVIVVFHGNTGQAADRIYIGRELADQNSVVLLAEYPGYGERPGSPSYKSLIESALENITFLNENFPDLPVILVGESLGSSVAIEAATHVPVSGLVLVSPFTSLRDVAALQLPPLPLQWLVTDPFDSQAALPRLKDTPLLVIHGKNDSLIPFPLGQKLFDLYTGPKEMLAISGKDHNDLPWDDPKSHMWLGIKDFLNTL